MQTKIVLFLRCIFDLYIGSLLLLQKYKIIINGIIKESFCAVRIWIRIPSILNRNTCFSEKDLPVLWMYSMMSWKHWFSVALGQIIQTLIIYTILIYKFKLWPSFVVMSVFTNAQFCGVSIATTWVTREKQLLEIPHCL